MTTYFVFIFPFLIIATVQGKITECFVGGVTEMNCTMLMNESVLNKYISKIVMWQTGSENAGSENDGSENDGSENALDVTMDYPYINYNGNFERDYETSLFLSTLYTNHNLITYYWKIYHSVGTDLFRLKFHSKLVTLYKRQYPFTAEEMIIFIKSCYNAASIYFFYHNYTIAANVLDDGLYFIGVLQQNYDEYQFNIEVATWSVIYRTFKMYLILQYNNHFYYTYDTNFEEESQKLNEDKEMLNNIMVTDGITKYPIAYLLIYREYILDEDFINDRQNVIEVISNEALVFDDDDKDFIYYSTYYHIVCSLRSNLISSNNEIEVFEHLLMAVQNPILHTEDRLLNYVANELLRIKYEQFTQVRTLNELNYFNSILAHFASKNEVYGDIINKLKYRNEYQYDNILNNLQEALNRDDFDEKLVRMFVINLSNLEVDPYRVQKIIQVLDLLSNKIRSILLENEHNRKPRFHNKDVCVLYKWSFVINTILSNEYPSDSDENKLYKNISANDLDFAIACMKKQNNIRDTHLDYLTHIYYSQVEGNKFLTVDGIMKSHLPQHKKGKRKLIDIAKHYNEFQNIIDHTNRFEINKIEALIYMYVLNAEINFHLAMNLLKRAISLPVINTEDRLRNKEAHELLSLYMLIHKDCIF